VRDANGQALSYIYYESEPGRRSAAKLLTRDEARRIAGVIAQDLMRGQVYNALRWCHATENTTMQQMQLWIFWSIIAAFLVCGCILTRKPTKKPPKETLRPARDEHQPGYFGLEEERGVNWKGSGGTVPSIKEAKPSL
jgi:hypothetical protein